MKNKLKITVRAQGFIVLIMGLLVAIRCFGGFPCYSYTQDQSLNSNPMAGVWDCVNGVAQSDSSCKAVNYNPNPVTYSSCEGYDTMLCSSCSDPSNVNYIETDTVATPVCSPSDLCIDPVVQDPASKSVNSYTEVSCPDEGCIYDDY